jgi:hypothetical protein
MENIHHRPIKKFGIDGIISDESSIVRLRSEYSKLLDSEMRLSGYVPRLDINQDFTIQYNIEKEYFEFKLSAYAIYVGKKKSKWISGIDETRVVYTQKSKSNEFLREVA